MSVLNRLACSLGRRDEVPNQELARDLAARKDKAGIREIAENLWNKDKNIQADCIKVLYETGYVEPALIAPYAEDFVKLLKSKNNRLVWGGMIALGVVAKLSADEVFKHFEEIKKAMDAGSVITKDNGVKVLADAASAKAEYNKVMFPYLLNHLKTCRPKDVAQHTEKTLPAVNASNKAEFIKALEKRMEDLSGSGLTRVKKVVKQAANL
ncbi:MAG: hypothetical protein HZB19_16930 [Chloroflexi bacterium]|nr:hypothetical protein [Chloroflexota bacterium]